MNLARDFRYSVMVGEELKCCTVLQQLSYTLEIASPFVHANYLPAKNVPSRSNLYQSTHLSKQRINDQIFLA